MEALVNNSGIFIAVGAIVAAFVALYSTYRAAKMSSDANEMSARTQVAIKAAEFRQQWINELRVAMNEFISLMLADEISGETRNRLNVLITDINLRMNKRDGNLEKLLNCINRMKAARRSGESFSEEVDEYTNLCQDILKTEWDRLKNDLRLRVV